VTVCALNICLFDGAALALQVFESILGFYLCDNSLRTREVHFCWRAHARGFSFAAREIQSAPLAIFTKCR
jgi:hypothetical protein